MPPKKASVKKTGAKKTGAKKQKRVADSAKPPQAGGLPDRRVPGVLAVAIFQYLETRPSGESNGNGGPEVWRLMAALDQTEPLTEPA